MDKSKHWTKVQLLHDSVNNSNIIIQGKHSYYSDYLDAGFEPSVVRYLYGDHATKDKTPRWTIDKLYIGDYVCIAPEVVILMGGNHTHRADWFCLYPFSEHIENAYIGKGNTHIHSGAWLGMRAMIMPGVTIGEGAVIGANSVVTKDVPPYCVYAGNPAKLVAKRFSKDVIDTLLSLNIYQWSEDKFKALRPYLCANDLNALQVAIDQYDSEQNIKP